MHTRGWLCVMGACGAPKSAASWAARSREQPRVVGGSVLWVAVMGCWCGKGKHGEWDGAVLW